MFHIIKSRSPSCTPGQVLCCASTLVIISQVHIWQFCNHTGSCGEFSDNRKTVNITWAISNHTAHFKVTILGCLYCEFIVLVISELKVISQQLTHDIPLFLYGHSRLPSPQQHRVHFHSFYILIKYLVVYIVRVTIVHCSK